MEHTIFLLLLCCAVQVFADPDVGTQTLDCDTTVQNQHRLLLQYGKAHLTTIRAAMKYINDNLQDLTQREQNMKDEAAKTSGVSTLLQGILTKIKDNGATACEISAEKQPIENEVINLNSRLLEMDFTLNVLTSLKETSLLQLKQMQAQEKEIEISILHQEQQGTAGPLENIETYLAAQLERSHETLDFERLSCQHRLEASSKLMDAKLEQVESAKNYSLCDLNNEIDLQKKKQKQTDDHILKIEQQLHDANTSQQICNVKVTESTQRNNNIAKNLTNCETSNINLSSKMMKLEAELQEKSRQLDAALRTTTTTTTTRPTTWVPPQGSIVLSTGTYFFNSQRLNLTSARRHCQSLGMDLLAIETEEENVAVANHARTVLSSGYNSWTSGCYSQEEDAVVWRSTGHEDFYTNWNPDDNHGNFKDKTRCVLLVTYDKFWWEIPINVQQPSICEKE